MLTDLQHMFARTNSRKATANQDGIPPVVRKKLEQDYPHMLEPPDNWEMAQWDPPGATMPKPCHPKIRIANLGVEWRVACLPRQFAILSYHAH